MKKTLPFIAFLLLQFIVNAQPWQTMTDVPLDFTFPVAVELRGDIHVMGGGSSVGATDLHVRYSPATNTWDTLAPVPYLAQQPAGAVVDGKIHFCGGGYPTSGQRLDSHYYYDVDSNAWYTAANLPVAVAIHKCVELDGKLYVLSGQPDKTLCESYDPVTDQWTQHNPLPDQNFWYGAIVNAAGTIFRFGGGGYAAPTGHANVYDKVNDTWLGITALPLPIHSVAGANVGDSLIWVGGGYANGMELDSMWIYNIAAQTYTPTNVLPIARDYHSMVTAGGCVYSIGGNNNSYPQVGVSMLKNCAPLSTGVQGNKNDKARPYALLNSNSLFQLHLNASSLGKSAAIKLIDMTGRTMLIQELNKSDGRISISNQNLSAGMYLVFISIEGDSFTEQWMVSK